MHRYRLILTILLILSSAFLLHGHAILLTATPSIGQVVRGPDIEVSLRFNSRVDAKRSRITLVPQDKEPRILTVGEQSAPDSLGTQAHGLKSGSYILRWQVLAADGHISRGEVPFRVE
jgi:copper resistance protein C